MDRFSSTVTEHKKSVLTVYMITALICVVCLLFTSVNYKMADYLPKDANSTQAINIIENEFDDEMPNSRVMINNVTIHQAIEYKEKLSSVKGVSSVIWLDDIIGVNTLKSVPLEYLDEDIVNSYYKNNAALYSITIKNGEEKAAVKAVREIIGEGNYLAGDGVNSATMQEMSVSEIVNAMLILLPVVLIILILSTSSWIEPLLFLASIGIAVIINLGTNFFYGEISFITQSVSPVLQLAVSLDYAIFLLHSFSHYRISHEPTEAMRLAMKRALPAIAASAATTVIGFAALMFMRFEIGADLGINLVKGVLLSFISVMTFLPALTLASYRLIDKTRHRMVMPDMRGLALKLIKISKVFFIIAVFIVLPCFLAQRNIDFMYGMSDIADSTLAGSDARKIDQAFGKENTLVLLVPGCEAGKESMLCDDLIKINNITGIASYVSSVGAQIPYQFVPNEAAEQFYSQHYARIILYTDLKEEGEQTFDTVKSVLNSADKYYDEYYLAGQAATLYDMKNIVSADINIINIIAVIGIFVVLLLTFRSLSLPILLLFTIETAIWVNLSVAYFSSTNSFSFIGYLIISTVQLGSTVDYAILLTDRYMLARKEYTKKDAIKKALGENISAIIISAAILSSAGFILMLTTTNSIIAQLGMLLGRGTLLSLVTVSCVLPALLTVFDSAISKTTLKNGFLKNKKRTDFAGRKL